MPVCNVCTVGCIGNYVDYIHTGSTERKYENTTFLLREKHDCHFIHFPILFFFVKIGRFPVCPHATLQIGYLYKDIDNTKIHTSPLRYISLYIFKLVHPTESLTC